MILMALDDVRAGMRLARSLFNQEGHTLLGAGVALTPSYIERLRDLGYWALWIDDDDTDDIVYRDIVSESTRATAAQAVRQVFVLAAHEVRSVRTAPVQQVREALESRRFAARLQDHPAIERLLGRVDTVISEVMAGGLVSGLGALRSRDAYTFDHALDVAITGTMIGRLLGYGDEVVRRLAVGCMLHDIGTIFVEDAILLKPGPLTEPEMARVREHCLLGYLFIRDNLKLGPLAAYVAYQHHERQDGAGYPRGLVGTNRIVPLFEANVPGRINPLGEVAAIANAYSSLSTDSPFRRALPPDQVWQHIRDGAGTLYNREMVDRFLAVVPPYPVGTQIVVREGPYRGYRGVVVRVPREAVRRPLVRLLTDDRDRRIEPVELDLLKERVEIRSAFRATAEAEATEPVAVR